MTWQYTTLLGIRMLDCSGFKKEHIHGVAEQIHLTRGHRVGREAYIIHRGLISSQVVTNFTTLSGLRILPEGLLQGRWAYKVLIGRRSRIETHY